MENNNLEIPLSNDGWVLASIIKKPGDIPISCFAKEIKKDTYEFKPLDEITKEKIKEGQGLLTFPFKKVEGENGAIMKLFLQYEIKSYLKVERKKENG